MKTQNCNYKKVLVVIFSLLILGCSSDGDDTPTVAPDPVYIVSNLDTTIEENPEAETVLGTLSTDLPGMLTYSSSNAAFDLEISSLEVFVSDRTAFDYELNPEVTGTIILSNGEDSVTATITIKLTDLGDGIANVLTSSKDAYDSALQGDWIEITGDEFALLETQLEAVGYSGLTEEEYAFDGNIAGISRGNSDTQGFSVAYSDGVPITEGSYLFAIRFWTGTGTFGKTAGNLIKISETSETEGYAVVGNPLPEKTSADRELFFVLKRNTVAINGPGHLALHIAPLNGFGFALTNRSGHFAFGDVTEFVSEPRENTLWTYQGLSTTKLQWE